EPVKETKAQKAERLKRELNPWEAYDDIVRFARDGFQSIPAEWLNTYFRWWGVYTQGDGIGAVGGKGGQGKAVPHFMVRIRILNGNPDFYNLPRKYKISITGCRAWCSYPEINDVGLTAIRHPDTGEVGFSLRIGGGLSTDPHLAVRLDAFVHWNQVLPVVKGVSELFRDSAVLRENREKARLKFLFLVHGWTAERFQRELERRIGFARDPA